MAPKRKRNTEFVRKTSTQSASEDSMGPQILGRNSGSIYLKRIKMLKRRMLKLHQENLLLKATNEQLVMKTNETTLNSATINEARNILLTDSFNLMVEYNRTKEANKKLQEVINVLRSDLTNAIGHLGNLSITLINATQYASIATSERPSQDNQETDSPHFSNNYPDQRSRGQKSARVSPMVRGLPIQSPTIKLRRVQVPPTEYDNVSVDEARLSRHETRMAEGPRYENPLSPIVEEEEEGQIRRKKGRLGHRFNNRRSFPGLRQVNGVSTTEQEALMNLEPVVRLRDVSALLNNSSLCTIPQLAKEVKYICVDGRVIPHHMVKMEADGECLFSSLSYLLYGTVTLAGEVRIDVVRHVSKNWKKYKVYSIRPNGSYYSSKPKYLSEMLDRGTYGTTCELMAAGEKFPYRFEVYSDGNLLAKFGEALKGVKRLRFSGDMLEGNFDALLPFDQPVPTFNPQLSRRRLSSG